MICPYCGKDNSDDLETCDFCGGSLLAGTDRAVTETPPSEPPAKAAQINPETLVTADEAMASPSDAQSPGFDENPPTPATSSRMYNSRVLWIVGCVVFLCIVLACIAVVLGLYRFTRSIGLFNPAPTTILLSATPPVTFAVGPTLSPSVITSAVTPELSTQALPGILFYDDFSDINSGWDRVNESNYSTGYYQGSYRITVNAKSSDSWANPAGQDFTDVSIEADATKNGGPDDNDFGLICRYLDTDRFYYAVVSSDGYYGITKVSSEASSLLGRDSLEYSDAIHQGYAMNQLRFDCIGPELTLYVNRELVDQQTDSDYTHGNVGLIAGSYDTPGTDILFDNYGVYVP